MKKRYPFALILLLVLSHSAFAQERHIHQYPSSTDHQNLLPAYHGFSLPAATSHQFNPALAAKGTATGSRLVGICGYYPSGGVSDSVAYTYSGHRGGDQNTGVKPDRATTYSWDNLHHNCVPSYRYLYTHDTWDSVTEILYQRYIDGVYKNGARYTYQRDNDGLTTVSLIEAWDTVQAAWTPSFSTVCTYANKQPVSSTNYTSGNTSAGLVPQQRYIWLYDSTGHELSRTTERYNQSSGSWASYSRYICTYDTAGNQTTYTSQDWDLTTNNWGDPHIYTYYYNSSNQCTSYSWQIRELKYNYLYNMDSVSYLLDTSGNATTIYTYHWDSDHYFWNPSYLYLYSYNSYGEMVDRIDKYWSGTSYISSYAFHYTYNNGGQVLTFQDQTGSTSWSDVAVSTRWYYEQYDSTAAAPAAGSTYIYPNPTQGLLHVATTGYTSSFIQVTDITGRHILQVVPIWRETDIDLSSQPLGLYIIEVYNGAERTTLRACIVH